MKQLHTHKRAQTFRLKGALHGAQKLTFCYHLRHVVPNLFDILPSTEQLGEILNNVNDALLKAMAGKILNEQ